jgi:two-component system NtrC family sensor kinase
MFPKALSLKTKLILSFSSIIVVGVSLSALVGIILIGNTVIGQAQDKVRLDLNTAREIYQQEGKMVNNTMYLLAQRYDLIDAVKRSSRKDLLREFRKIKESEQLDVLSVTDSRGRVIIRSRNPDSFGDRPYNELIDWVLRNKLPAAATESIPAHELEKEGADLARAARVDMIPTPKARKIMDTVETSGLMIMGASPLFDARGQFIGTLYGGKLLNNNHQIVDKVKDIVYKGEKYKGKDIGTTTIFLNDLRIATNVRGTSGARAVGTRVSREVYDQVMSRGLSWIGRAFVVNDWYRTAYEPIRNINGKIVGILYVGMLEAPYIDLRNRTLALFLVIAGLTVVLLWFSANYLAGRIVGPIRDLVAANSQVAGGDLSVRVQISSRDEIGQLSESFNQMTAELQRATEEYKLLNLTLEQRIREKTEELKAAQDQLIQTEKLSSLGKMAAGIAHEINNPLTSILINSHLMSERIKGRSKTKESLQLIIDETSRCSSIVKRLLEFSRQSPPEKKPEDINSLILMLLKLFKNQLLFSRIDLKTSLDKRLPRAVIDANKIKQVFTNIIVNAIDAMPQGGTLKVTTELSSNHRQAEISFQDNGSGIPKEIVNKVFDPFFTTKGIKGSGLGLAISYGIIQQHDGAIEIINQKTKGVRVLVRLPISDNQ